VDVYGNLRQSLTAGATGLRDRLLGRAPAKDVTLPVLRAGFKLSGVSQANRLIERHVMADGRAYWKSYDFSRARHQDEGDLFLRPLEGAGEDGRDVRWVYRLPGQSQEAT
jgi:hypothetical protein